VIVISHAIFATSPWNDAWILCVGVDVDAARKKEQLMMLDDANEWLISGKYFERPHVKTGAMALHIAAAKGYVNVIRSVHYHHIYDCSSLFVYMFIKI